MTPGHHVWAASISTLVYQGLSEAFWDQASGLELLAISKI